VPDPKAGAKANVSRITGDAIYLARVAPKAKTINASKKYEYYGSCLIFEVGAA